MGEGSNAYIPSNPEVAPLFSHDLLSQTLVVVPHLSAPFRCIYHVVGRAAVDWIQADEQEYYGARGEWKGWGYWLGRPEEEADSDSAEGADDTGTDKKC